MDFARFYTKGRENFEKTLDILLLLNYIIIVATKRGEKMATTKKGRPTSSPKDYMLRVRMDKETVEKLDTICETHKVSRSEAVRNGIEEQYRKIKK